jgi:hypothetical protein
MKRANWHSNDVKLSEGFFPGFSRILLPVKKSRANHQPLAAKQIKISPKASSIGMNNSTIVCDMHAFSLSLKLIEL